MIASALVLAISATSANAQTAVPEPVADTPDGQIETVVVTARKRNELSVDVPSALTVFTGKTLEAINVKELSQLASNVPGLFLQQRGNLQTSITIRGVGGDPRNIGIESGVGVTIDGVSAGRTAGYNVDLARISTVEVLKGPQGTLFGTNTIGGAINITTIKPGNKFEAGSNVQYGRFGSFRTSTYVTVPLSDTLSIGATVSNWKRDGLVQNVTLNIRQSNINRLGGLFQLMWRPSDRLSVYASADATRNFTRQILSQIIPPYVGAVATIRPASRYQALSDQPSLDNIKFGGGSLNVEYSLPSDFTFNSITGFRKIDEVVFADQDGTALNRGTSGPFTDESRLITQELRVATPSSAPIRGVAGLYYQNTVANSFRLLTVNGSYSNGLGYTNTGRIRTNVYAAFGNLDAEIIKRLSLTVGARINKEDKLGYFAQFRPSVPGTSYLFDNNLKRDDSALSWTGGLKYKFDPDAALHFTVSRGFKSGGFNFDAITVTNATPATLTFRPETATNYELALKGMFFDRRLQLAASLFHLDYKDRQVSQFNVVPGSTITTVTITNAAQQTSDGGEIQATVALPHRILLDASYAYTRARYDSFPRANAAGASFDGNVVEYSPAHTASVTISGDIPHNSGKFVYAINGTYTSKIYMDAANNPINVQPSYTLLNFRTGYEQYVGIKKSKVGVYLWARNATDKLYYTLRRQYTTYNQGSYGEPRTYGLELAVTY